MKNKYFKLPWFAKNQSSVLSKRLIRLSLVGLLTAFGTINTQAQVNIELTRVVVDTLCKGLPQQGIGLEVRNLGAPGLVGRTLRMSVDGSAYSVISIPSSIPTGGTLIVNMGNYITNVYTNHTIHAYFVGPDDTDKSNDTLLHTYSDWPTPVSSFTTANVCNGDSVSFTNTSTIASGSFTSAWAFRDATYSSAFSPNHLYGGTGTFAVLLTNTSGAGCTSSATVPVTVYPVPVADFSFTSACAGAATTFINKTYQASGTYSSAWDFGDGNTSTSSSPGHIYATAGTYSAQLIVTSNNGCVDTVTKSVTVYPNPVAGFTASNVCDGASVQFLNTTTLSSGTYTQNWSFRDATYSTVSSPSHIYPGPGTYQAQISVTTSFGCTDIATNPVTIYPNPVANFGADNECNGDAVSFNNLSTITSGTMTYAWAFRDATYSTATNPTHTYPGTGTYNVLLTATSDNGCEGSIEKPVTIHVNPVASFTSSNACEGTATMFTNTTTLTSGTYTSDWDLGDGNVSVASSPTHTYSSPGTKTVSLTVTSNNGCTSTFVNSSFEVYEEPNASFTAADVCDGDAVNFTNTTSLSGSGTFTSYWSFKDATYSYMTSPSHTYPGPGTYNVLLEATSNNGCVGSATMPVTVNPNPVASFNAMDVCMGNDVTFNNTSTITQGTIYSSWTFGDGGTSALTTPTYNYSSAGTYTVNLSLTSNKGCTDATSSNVTVSPGPIASFTTNNVCDGVPTSFTNNSTIPSGTYTSYWKFGDGNISNDQTPTHTYSGAKTYTVTLTVSSDNECSTTTTNPITIYPNPVAQFTTKNVCDGVAADFNNTSYIASGSFTSHWAFRDATYSTDMNPSHVFAGVQTYNVLLTLTSDQGCTGSVENPITIWPNPVANFTTRDVCDQDAASFTNTSTVTSGVVNSVFWDFGDNRISYDRNPTHTYFNPGTYNVTATATSNRGCKNSVTKPITIHPNPVADFTVANVCHGFDIAPVNNSTGASTYYWIFGDSYYSSDMSPTHGYARPGTYDINLTATSGFGCTHDVTRPVTIWEKPVIYTSGDTSVSKGHSVQISAWSSLKGNFLWDNASLLDDETSPDPTATIDNTTQFTVITTTPDGCMDTGSLTITAIADYIVYPTNIITPNNDGSNDVMEMGNLYNYPNNSIIFFDRWGREVYQQDLYTGDWAGTAQDGTELPSGAYFYILTFDMNENVTYKGSVTILRTN